MGDYEFPAMPKLEEAIRVAYRALTDLVAPGSVTDEGEVSFPEMLSQFRVLVDNVDLLAAAQLGPRVSWQAPRPGEDFELMMSGVDLDDGTYDFDDVVLNPNALEGPAGAWHDSALGVAGLVYKRACGWDFPPGEAGVWLVMLAPIGASGGEDGPWFYSGHLVGFVVVYDRDEDGTYESVGHIWTAKAWQRRGIARRLLAQARSRFAISDVEGPYTEDGAAFLNALADPEPTS